MCITEYDEKKTMELFARDAREAQRKLDEAVIAEKDGIIAAKDEALAAKEREIEELKRQLAAARQQVTVGDGSARHVIAWTKR